MDNYTFIGTLRDGDNSRHLTFSLNDAIDFKFN